MPWFDHAGVRLHYLTRGSGRHVLLVHGLGSSGGDWAFQVPALEAHRRVILPDLRGSGLSDAPPGPYSIATLAADLWALADSLGVEELDVVGFSLGGAVALEMALQRPDRVTRLVLVNSLASYRIDHWRKWVEARFHAWTVRVSGLQRTAALVARRVFPGDWQAAMRERAVRVIGAARRRPYLATVAALERWCARDRLDRLRSRVLVIAAEHDYTPLAEKRQLAARLGAQLVVVAGSRHGTPFDAIGITNATLVAFLRDEPLPAADAWRADAPEEAPSAPPPGSVAHEHAEAAATAR